MTDHTPEPCGCRTEGEYFRSIVYCPTHAAAPDLLADGTAFLEAVERHFNIDNDAVTFGPEARAFRAAIAKAKEEKP